MFLAGHTLHKFISLNIQFITATRFSPLEDLFDLYRLYQIIFKNTHKLSKSTAYIEQNEFSF